MTDHLVFDEDIRTHGGYRYTDTALLSCRLAHARTVELITESGLLHGRSVIDIGCGDGFFTNLILKSVRPKSIVGVDIAREAIERASSRVRQKAVHDLKSIESGTMCSTEAGTIRFAVGDAHDMQEYADNSFDVALFNGMLHHLDDPYAAIKEGLRLAPNLVIFEPNGSNPGLKLIEKVSAYHLRHQEKSYSYARLRNWIEKAGGTVVRMKRGGFVPYFWPDFAARGMKVLEPIIERTPLLNVIAPAYCVISVARRSRSRAGDVHGV